MARIREFLLIRLIQHATNAGVSRHRAASDGPARPVCGGRCRRASSAEANQRLESGHGLPSAIVWNDELVHVDPELSAAHAVRSADQPLLQGFDRAVGHRHYRLRALAQLDSQRLCARDVLETLLAGP